MPRYNVHYTVDDAVQNDVREEKIRATKKTAAKRKKKAAKKAGGKKRAADGNVKTPAKKKGRAAGSKNKKKKAESPPPEEPADVDEGDPPFRTTGHEYLSRKVQYTPEGASAPVIGIVTGWIAETDVDSDGNPGFTCSKTGEPARLFHVVFDDIEQDFEEFELEECLIDE